MYWTTQLKVRMWHRTVHSHQPASNLERGMYMLVGSIVKYKYGKPWWITSTPIALRFGEAEAITGWYTFAQGAYEEEGIMRGSLKMMVHDRQRRGECRVQDILQESSCQYQRHGKEGYYVLTGKANCTLFPAIQWEVLHAQETTPLTVIYRQQK